MNNALKVNEKLKKQVKTVEIGGLEFVIKVVDIFDMLELADEKIKVLSIARKRLGLKPFQAIPKDKREEYSQIVGEITEKEYLKEINEKSIKGFIKSVLPKACVDPIVVDKPKSEIDVNKEVSLELLIENLDISVTLVNEILTFSIDNSLLYSDMSEKIGELSQVG